MGMVHEGDGERKKEKERERGLTLISYLINAIHPRCNAFKRPFVCDIIDKYDSLREKGISISLYKQKVTIYL